MKNKESQLFWFAAYGKLMKTKNLMKILNYYNVYGSKKALYNNSTIKEKSIKIDDFETFFQKNSNKLYIKYSKGNYILAKLYLLTLKEISSIFKYMNRTEYEIKYDILNYLQKKGSYLKMDNKKNKFIFPYGLIYYLGDYMNMNIFTFSNMSVINNDSNNDNDYRIVEIKYELPKSKKIIKLIKAINRSFPDLSIDDIINYLIPEKKYINSFSKISEIKNILFFNIKLNQSKIILSSMVKDTIKGIPIPSAQSVLSSFCPETFDSQIRNIDFFKNISFPISTFKEEYNMQIINSKDNTFINDVSDNKEKGIKTNLDKSKKNKSNNHNQKKSKKKRIIYSKKEKKNKNDFSRSEKVLNKSNHNRMKNRINKGNFILNNYNIYNSFKYNGSKNQSDIFNNSPEFNYNC